MLNLRSSRKSAGAMQPKFPLSKKKLNSASFIATDPNLSDLTFLLVYLTPHVFPCSEEITTLNARMKKNLRHY